MSRCLAVIGGTALRDLPGLELLGEEAYDTPWGAPSDVLRRGRLGGTELLFLDRHGPAGKIPPHAINYRANMQALADAGAQAALAVNAVGGIGADFGPPTLCLPDDLIDYSWGRAHSYSDGNTPLQHVEFAPPYDPVLAAEVAEAAKRAGVALRIGGVYGVTQGPRLETAAEITRMARDGCDVVGMTAMPEAGLARELGLPYASLAVVVNWAAGRHPEGGGIHADIAAHLDSGVAQVRRILSAL